MSSYTVPSFRAKAATNPGTIERLESTDGNRRAYGNFRKRSLGCRRFEVVVAYTLRERTDGKMKVIGSGYDRDYAVNFINSAV